jgi:hypothetical protein
MRRVAPVSSTPQRATHRLSSKPQRASHPRRCCGSLEDWGPGTASPPQNPEEAEGTPAPALYTLFSQKGAAGPARRGFLRVGGRGGGAGYHPRGSTLRATARWRAEGAPGCDAARPTNVRIWRARREHPWPRAPSPRWRAFRARTRARTRTRDKTTAGRSPPFGIDRTGSRAL